MKIILILLLLAGCQTVPRIETKQVEVVVTKYCDVPIVAKPVFYLELYPIPKTGDISEKDENAVIDALFLERVQRMEYEEKLSAALEKCRRNIKQ